MSGLYRKATPAEMLAIRAKVEAMPVKTRSITAVRQVIASGLRMKAEVIDPAPKADRHKDAKAHSAKTAERARAKRAAAKAAKDAK